MRPACLPRTSPKIYVEMHQSSLFALTDRPTDRGLVKLTIILSDLDDFSEMNSAYSDFFKASRVGTPPARTTFQAGGRMPKNAK